MILYPFWKLFAWIANLIGVNGIRYTNGKLETPVVLYEHPETKRFVVFIAAIHIAEPEYYASLQQIVESLSGYKILFEGVGNLSQEEEQSLTEKERGVKRQFDYAFRMTRKIGELMSLQHQKEGLSYDSTWVNADMRMYDLIQLFVRQNVHFIKERKDDLFKNETYHMLDRWFVGKLFSQFVPLTVLFKALAFLLRNAKSTKKLILDERNKVAVSGIHEHLAESNVATIWGAAHLSGIEKSLKKAGFREIRRDWFIAFHPYDYSLLACLKKMMSDKKTKIRSAKALRGN